MSAGPRERKWILCVDDEEHEIQRVRECLPRSEFPVTSAHSAAEARIQLSTTIFELLLLDHSLPDTNALAFLEEIQKLAPNLPVILLTGRDDDAMTISAVRKGAASFLMKEDITRSLPAVIRETLDAHRSARPEDEAPGPSAGSRLLAQSERVYRMLLETMNEACVVVDAENGVVTYANMALARLIDADPDRTLGKPALDLFDEDTVPRMLEVQMRMTRSRSSQMIKLEGRIARRGRSVPVLISIRTLHDDDGRHEATLMLLADISEVVRARDELTRSQTELAMRVAELERFQKFMIDREERIIELKKLMADYERRLGISHHRLSNETREELDRRLASEGLHGIEEPSSS